MDSQGTNKWHITDDGTPGRCFADTRLCPKGSNAPHFDSAAEVYEYFKDTYEGNAMGSLRKSHTIHDDDLYDDSDDGVHEDHGPEEFVKFS